MRVWRIENEGGTGPYQSTSNYRSPLIGTIDWDIHVVPVDDPGLWDFEWEDFNDPRFGFASLQHFLTWFSQDMLDRLWGEFYLVEYECDEIQFGHHQCVFNRETAQVMKRIIL